MRAVILAGGKGTRLAPYTTVLPKPLLPIGDRPILELILRQLERAGFEEVDLSVGHLGGLIQAYLTERSGLEGLTLRYMWEDEPLGTAGPLRLLDAPDEPFLVMNGDILTSLDFGELMEFHRREAPALTIAVHRKLVKLELGVIEGDAALVTGYVEKPTLEYEVSMGIYVYSPEVLGHIPPGRFDFPDVVLALLAAGERVAKFPFTGPWLDMGTRDEYERAMAEFGESPELFDPSTG
jgi:NDP-sugar pyrophosphorylase family protein